MNLHDLNVTAKLYECRDAAKFILGSTYDETLYPWRHVISDYMQLTHASILQAAVYFGSRTKPDEGPVVMLIMAAAVEMIEDVDLECRDAN